MSRPIAMRFILSAVALLVVSACGDEGETPAPTPAPSPVKMQVEGAPVQEAPAARLGLDASGRLVAAAQLVAGFEVPMRAKLKQTRRQYLELALSGSSAAITEFYTGIDQRSGRRFAARDYDVEVTAPTGDINIRHTPKSLRRLKLDAQHDKTHIAIRKLSHWSWLLRVYDVRNPELGREFEPDLGAASMGKVAPDRPPAESMVSAGGAPAAPNSASRGDTVGKTTDDRGGGGMMQNRRNGRSEPSSPSRPKPTSTAGTDSASADDGGATTDFAKAWDAESARAATATRNSDNPPSRIGGLPKQSGQMTIQDHPPGRYGPYPPSGRRSIRERVRQWQVAHPNQKFLD